MKIFLSYSHLDKSLAGKVKKYLRQYGAKVFLVHDDIEPSEEGADKILEKLDNKRLRCLHYSQVLGSGVGNLVTIKALIK